MSTPLIRSVSREHPIEQEIVQQLLFALAEHSAPLVMRSVQKGLNPPLSSDKKDILAQRFYDILTDDFTAKVRDFIKVHGTFSPNFEVNTSSLQDKTITTLKWNPRWDQTDCSEDSESFLTPYETFLARCPYAMTAAFIHDHLCPTVDYLEVKEALPLRLGIIAGRLSPLHVAETPSTPEADEPFAAPSYRDTSPDDNIPGTFSTGNSGITSDGDS